MSAPSQNCFTQRDHNVQLGELRSQLEKVVILGESFGLLRRPEAWDRWSEDERSAWASWQALQLRARSQEPTVAAMFASAGRVEAIVAPAPHNPQKPRFVRTADLVETTLALANSLPPGLAGIAAIPRSGMLPASQLALHLHLPLYSLKDGVLYEIGHGFRLRGARRRSRGPILVVDDTVHNGGTISGIRERLGRRGKSYVAPLADGSREPAPLLWAVSYAEPRGRHLVDFVGADLPTPHLLEWNLFSCPWSQHFATDFDGILCPDFTPEEDDDGPRYLKALRTRQPLHLFRYGHLPLIVTARLEKYRAPTERWLRRWGVQVGKLVMGPWATQAERSRVCLGTWKSEQVNAHLPGAQPPIGMFIESDPIQAAIMAQRTSCSILCPEAGGII